MNDQPGKPEPYTGRSFAPSGRVRSVVKPEPFKSLWVYFNINSGRFSCRTTKFEYGAGVESQIEMVPKADLDEALRKLEFYERGDAKVGQIDRHHLPGIEQP